MKVTKLGLRDFRNIATLSLCPAGQVNVLYGDNAQGKTNLIESIWLMTGAKSFRGATDEQLVRFGQPAAQIELGFYAGGREQTARLVVGEKKRAFLNEVPQPSSARLAGNFCAVVFSPVHLALIKGGPAERRRFTDQGLGQVRPQYLQVLAGYHQVLRERNALLKDISYSSSLLDTLDIWDMKLARLATLVTEARARYLQAIGREAAAAYTGISSCREEMALCYQPAPCFMGERAGWEAACLDALRQSREQDLRAGTTQLGPHRDEVEVLIDGRSARSFGSQGQQRSAVLALKLGESRVLAHACGEEPVVLLDDVLSELDRARRDFLLGSLTESQVFITCCDDSLLSPGEGRAVFSIRAGQLSEGDAAADLHGCAPRAKDAAGMDAPADGGIPAGEGSALALEEAGGPGTKDGGPDGENGGLEDAQGDRSGAHLAG